MSAPKQARRRRATITLIPDSSFIQEGQSANLSGEVRVNGRLASGIVIVFAVDCSIGAVVPSMAITNARGRYRVRFQSFVSPTPIEQRVASITAALPSFPGVATGAVIAILPSSSRARGRKGLKKRTGCPTCTRKLRRG